MIDYIYKRDYRIEHDDVNCFTDDSSRLLLHSHVYAMAEMYALEGLKDLAVRKANGLASISYPLEQVRAWATHAYTATLDTKSNRGMRKSVASKMVALHRAKEFDEEMWTFLRNMPELNYDILLELS